jgi:hypothetical protein
MKVCNSCKNKDQCADLPGICLKIPYILAAGVAAMLALLLANSNL